MSSITPQYLAYDSAPLTYTAVSSNDVIYPLTGAMVLHIFNAGAIDDLIVFYSPTVLEEGQTGIPCKCVPLEAGSEVLIGPFDYVAYAPSLTVTHTTTADVYIAAFFSELILVETAIALATEVVVAALNPDYIYPLEAVELTTVNGVLSTTPTILAGVLPSATVEIGE